MSCTPASAAVIAAALVACGVCPSAPPVERFVIADKVDSSRCAPGQEVQARLDGVDLTDGKGRHAHIRGIFIEGLANLTVADGTSGAVSNFSLRGLFNAFFMTSATGHSWFNSLDGRTIDDDIWFRHWRRLANPALQIGSQSDVEYPKVTGASRFALAANVGAGDYEVDASLYIPLTDLYARKPLQGLIPLSLLRKRGANALRFKTGPSIPGNPADVTFTGWTTADGFEGLKIWLDLVYLPALVVDAEWSLHNYTKNELSGVLDYSGQAIEYAVVRYFPEDTSAGSAFSGQQLALAHDGVTLSIANTNDVAGYSTDEMIKRGMLFYMRGNGALTEMNSATDLPYLDETGNGLEATTMILQPYSTREGAPAGDYSYKYASRDASFTRYTQRVVKCQAATDAKRLADALQCDPCGIKYTDGKGNETSVARTFEPIVIETA
jgi:hypothetical protein